VIKSLVRVAHEHCNATRTNHDFITNHSQIYIDARYIWDVNGWYHMHIWQVNGCIFHGRVIYHPVTCHVCLPSVCLLLHLCVYVHMNALVAYILDTWLSIYIYVHMYIYILYSYIYLWQILDTCLSIHMHVYMYICKYMYTYIYTYTCTCTNRQAYVLDCLIIYILIYMHICTYIYMYIYLHDRSWILACRFIYMYMYKWTGICTWVSNHIYIDIYAYTYIYLYFYSYTFIW